MTQETKGTATRSFVYDAAGNRSQRTDYNGAITNYSYDALNRLTTISYPDTTSTAYGYDVLSRLTTATNPTGTVTIAYDNRGRVSSVTDIFGQVVGYSYDANSNRTQLTLNGANNATYQYDVIKRLTQLADNAALNTTFAYDATNKLTSRTLPNGVVSTYQYDGLDRLTRLTHAKGANTLLDLQYQFNPVNNITQMIDNAGTHNYSYDLLDRLTGATHPNQANESYSYDEVGNRTASHQGSSYIYQPFNRLVSANGTSFGYDANGNQISKTDASGSWTYTWDYENRLKQASLAGGVTVNYSFDALGRRIQRTSSASGTTKFVYDGDDVLRDLDASGITIADYLNSLDIDDKQRQTVSGSAAYFIQDRQGSTRALADSSGIATGNLTYDSFGNPDSSTASTRYTYTGREIDPETGLMYYRFRWYDPEQARFISEDPIGLEGGFNLYTYVQNNPVNLIDPLGLDGTMKLPPNPSGLPPSWKPDPSHHYPRGERFRHPNGDYVDFHRKDPAKSPKTHGGKDHWHHNGADKHLYPGDEIPDPDAPCEEPESDPKPNPDPIPFVPVPPPRVPIPRWVPKLIPILIPGTRIIPIIMDPCLVKPSFPGCGTKAQLNLEKIRDKTEEERPRLTPSSDKKSNQVIRQNESKRAQTPVSAR